MSAPTAPTAAPASPPAPGSAPTPAPAHDTRLQSTKTNLKYLALGSGAGIAPKSLTTRSFLTTLR